MWRCLRSKSVNLNKSRHNWSSRPEALSPVSKNPMPIRINLLAEQQAAEEARRRDPVKRALWVGGGLVALMVVWIVLLQLRLASAKAELNRYESKLQTVEEDSKEIRADWAAT